MKLAGCHKVLLRWNGWLISQISFLLFSLWLFHCWFHLALLKIHFRLIIVSFFYFLENLIELYFWREFNKIILVNQYWSQNLVIKHWKVVATSFVLFFFNKDTRFLSINEVFRNLCPHIWMFKLGINSRNWLFSHIVWLIRCLKSILVVKIHLCGNLLLSKWTCFSLRFLRKFLLNFIIVIWIWICFWSSLPIICMFPACFWTRLINVCNFRINFLRWQ